MTEQSQEAVNKATASLEKVIKLWKLKNNNNNTINPRKAIKRKVENSMMFLGRKISRKHLEPNSLEDITLIAQKVCEEYIEARLVRAGIKEYEYNSEVQTEEHLHVVKNMGQILEMKYPKLYTKISSHLKLSYENEIVVWDAFNKFGSHLFNDGITWARIIAFYAFTGGLAMDCMAQGKSELPARLVYWFGAFVMKKLAPWIQSQGGWDNIVDHFSSSHKLMDLGEEFDSENESNKKWLMIIKHLIQTNPSRAAVLAVFIFGLSITWLST